MIEICRCAKALFSALSMSWTRTPRLEAILRSITRSSCSPPGSRSLEMSVMPSTVSMRLATIGAHFCNRLEIGARQRVLIVGIALPAAGADVLRREHEQADAGHPIQTSACRRSITCVGRHAVPLLRRLQADEHRAAVRGSPPGPAPLPSDRADAGHRRIGHHDVGELLLQPQHRLERDIGRGRASSRSRSRCRRSGNSPSAS